MHNVQNSSPADLGYPFPPGSEFCSSQGTLQDERMVQGGWECKQSSRLFVYVEQSVGPLLAPRTMNVID